MEELIACWREAGEWWQDEAPREIVQYRDVHGVRRETIREIVAPGYSNPQSPYREDHREEIALRPRKIRDEKVARACGYLPERIYHGVLRAHSQPYAALHVMSGYAFGRSVLFAEEIPRHAAKLGISAIALADPFSLVGAIEFTFEARRMGVKPIVGASFETELGGEIVLIARDKRGYVSLSQLITECHLSEPRQFPLARESVLERHTRGLLCLTGGDVGPLNRLLLGRRYAEAEALLDRLILRYGRENVFVEIERSYLPWQHRTNRHLVELAQHVGAVPVAGGVVTHAGAEQFPAQDILVCADTLCTVGEVIGRKPRRDPSQPQIVEPPLRSLNAERRLRSPEEMYELYADAPELLENTLQIAERCDEDVLPSRTRLPRLFDDEPHALREIVYAGAHKRHRTITRSLERRLELELERIIRMNFAGHFLTIWDACRWAREQGILFSGRGSVVDCAVAYCLGLSRIDAHAHGLHFDRFLPEEGEKRPDIDIDFEAKHRDDVREYLTGKYGEDRVATVAAVGAFCTRGIVREVGKALGVAPETLGFLAKRLHGGVSPDQLEAALDARPELKGSDIPRERFQWIFRLAAMLADVPRNMRAHSSGVVISDQPLSETVPVMWSAAERESGDHLRIIQWDKRSAKHFFDKFDILCLRGQDVLSGTQERIRIQDHGFAVNDLPLDDEETYRAMRSGELIGIPQSASPAMRQAHMRLRTENLHDASLVQAGIRPGVGGAVKINELIQRRRGTKAYSFEHPELERILGQSYGIVVFQEQVDQLLQTFCGYGSGDAEDIRDKIHKRRREDYGVVIRDELYRRMRERGFPEGVAEHVFELISGFKGYGFAQGHALAFAEISIRSIYCQQNFPAPYFAALLDAQPAGYYGPCTLVNEARVRGVAILPIDVDRSENRFSVEDVVSKLDPKLSLPQGGIRIALTQISGLPATLRSAIVEHRPYPSFFEFVRKVKPDRDELEQLILCGAFDRLESNRRALLWAIPDAMSAIDRPGAQYSIPLDDPHLPTGIEDFSPAEKAVRERAVLGLDVERHLMAFERDRVQSRGGLTTSEARRLPHGRKAIVVGNPIRLRFPPTPSGKRVVFFDLEDETGLLNVTCFDATYRRDGHAIVCSPYVTVIGHAQDRDGHIAFLAERVFPYRPSLAGQFDAPLPVGTADFLVG